jgi:TonB-dependent starch-binding outer membrane protein SusC
MNDRRPPRHFLVRYLLMSVAAIYLISGSYRTHAADIRTDQGIAVSGKITDEANAALPGVSIIERGTTNGTVSDSDGNYRISVASRESILVFTFVGAKTQQITVGDQSNVSIQLLSDIETLGEVVVVGYGTQEKKDITGSVASVKSEDFNRGIINSPEQLLQGKVAGLNVTSASGEPGAAQGITIRGLGGVRTGSTPLFVVDGLALDNSSTGGAINPLNFLNPQDIESIDVLKDASATAIYGSRGANGVILITTKKGKAGQFTVNYSSSIALSSMARALPVFSADEYRQRVTEVGGVLEDSLASTDWQDEISRTALTQNHNISFGGGADKLTYFASLGLQDQEGILKNSNLKRYSGRINVSQKFLQDKVTLDLNLSASNTLSERPPIESVLGSAISTNPTYPAYDENGDPYKYPTGVNPLRTLDLYKDITSTNRIIGNISPSVKVIKGLEYRLNFGIDNSNSTRDEQTMPSILPPLDGRLKSTYAHNNNSLIENYLTYTYSTDAHSLSALVGHSYQKFFIQSRAWSINRFAISEVEPRYNPALGQDLTLTNNKPEGFATRNELQSFFGRLNYQFRDRYLFTATVRADGSSKFGKNNKYGTFPSFSLGWLISEEEFMASLPVSTLKLRAGWGQTEIPSKITQGLFTSQVSAATSYPLYPTGAYPGGTTFSRLANPDIQWEVSTQTNVGVDFGFLNGALSGSVDWFNKVSNNILLEVNAFDPQPANTYWTNVKDMTITNRGLELALNYRGKGAQGLSYSVGANVTFIHNEVAKSPYSVIPSGSATGSGLTSATINGYINGEPIGTFLLKEFIGFNEVGRSVFKDNDGDGYVTDRDRVAAGTAQPDTYYNFSGSVGYKGFDLTVNFNGVSGNKVYDNTAQAFFYKAKISKGVNTTDEATKYTDESISNPADVSDRYLKDASFLRLNNLALGYSFNPASLGIGSWITGLRLSITGQNLFVITQYDGYDPEVNTDKTINGISSFGIDYLSYPKAKTVVFGLNVSF